jgi:coniferyl-aldehyde dehydrogenase
VIVAPDYPIERAAARIASGKFINAGQTCIAPDYLLVPKDSVEPLVAALKAEATARYPDLAMGSDYTRIINRGQYERLRNWREDARSRGARVLPLIEVDDELAETQRLIAPTVVLDAPEDCALMQEEIFGPLLPIVTYERFEEALAYVKRRDRPLALYLFDHDRARIEQLLEHTIAGSVAINDTVLQFAQNNLPFGGVGPSGMGSYHGEAGFRTFSKEKPVFRQARWSGMSLFKPPYRGLADRLVRFLTR